MNEITINYLTNLIDAKEAAAEIAKGIDLSINEKFIEALVREMSTILLTDKVDKKYILEQLKLTETNHNYLNTLLGIHKKSIENDFVLNRNIQNLDEFVYELTPNQVEMEYNRLIADL